MASHFAFAVPAIAVTYVNSYAQANVADNLCGFGFGDTGADFKPTAVAASCFAACSAPATASRRPAVSTSSISTTRPAPSSKAGGVGLGGGVFDYNLDGARCIAGKLSDATVAANIKARAAQRQVCRGKPTIIVHGRNDALVPVNHASRPYVARKARSTMGTAKLSYIE